MPDDVNATEALLQLAGRHDLALEHPAEALREAQAFVREPGLSDSSLVDLERIAFVSVDGATTRDLDQALHVSRDKGGWRVRYALADAAFYVRPGSALWTEALQRGASYYLPGLSIPMLPRALSEGVISLNEGVLRRAMVLDITLDDDGRVQSTAVIRARIRSRAKLSFDDVQDFLEGGEPPRGDSAIGSSLRAFEAVGQLRMGLAEARGVVRYRRAELKTELADAGARFVALEEIRRPVEQYNEQLSLLSNIEGARLLQRATPGVQPIFRVHPPPSRGRIERLAQTLDALANARGLPAERWSWSPKSERSLASFLAALPDDRVAAAIHRQAVITNYRSQFDPEPAAHHGVGSSVYARFSAPMREVVGVFTHKETWELLGSTPRPSDAADEAVREQVVVAANRAKALQSKLDKEANLLVLDQLFADQPGPPRGTLVGLTPTRGYVLLDSPPIDVKVNLRDLDPAAGLRPDGVTVTAGKRLLCRLGDAVDVVALARDPSRRWWTLKVERAAG